MCELKLLIISGSEQVRLREIDKQIKFGGGGGEKRQGKKKKSGIEKNIEATPCGVAIASLFIAVQFTG